MKRELCENDRPRRARGNRRHDRALQIEESPDEISKIRRRLKEIPSIGARRASRAGRPDSRRIFEDLPATVDRGLKRPRAPSSRLSRSSFPPPSDCQRAVYFRITRINASRDTTCPIQPLSRQEARPIVLSHDCAL